MGYPPGMRTLPLTLLVACTTVVDLQEPGAAPTGIVLRPTPSEALLSGRLELLGRVSDPQDVGDHLFVTWSLGTTDAGPWEVACDGFAEPDGTTQCLADVRADHTAVQLRVVDLAGYEDDVVVPVSVRAAVAPEVRLDAPLAPGPFFPNVPVVVQASVSDADGSADDLAVRWVDSRDGELPVPTRPAADGLVQGSVTLSEGYHVLEVQVTDADGLVSTAESRFVVAPPNDPPSCRVDSPADGAAYLPGTAVAFALAPLDDVARPEDLAWTLTSSLDGVLASGQGRASGLTTTSVTPSPGEHAITVAVTDPWGATSACTQTLWIDTPPLLIVATPTEGQRVPRGQPLTVAVRVEDAVTPAADLTVRAISDRDGLRWALSPASNGELTVQTALSPGQVHTVRVEVEDALGLKSAQIFTIFAE